MSEGGLYPWRRQRPELDGVSYVDYSEILKPLPPPPDGLVWVKRRVEAAVDFQVEEAEADEVVIVEGEQGPEEGSSVVVRRAARFVWELVEKPARVTDGEEDVEAPLVELEDDDDLPDFIHHTVLATDTMAGLRLRYKITPAELRKHNDFAGENFHALPTLLIPIAGREEHIKKHKQRPTKEVLRQRFANATRCTDPQMQTYYLEANEWDLSAAVRECEEDRQWEEEHGARLRMTRVPGVEAAAAENDANNAVPIQRRQHQQRQEPPPSYSSFFKLKPRRSNNGGSRPSHYYPWPIAAASSSSTSALLRRPSARGGAAAYDLTNFAGGGEQQPGEDAHEENEWAVEGGGPGPVAVVAPAAHHHDNDEALRAPLLGPRVGAE